MHGEPSPDPDTILILGGGFVRGSFTRILSSSSGRPRPSLVPDAPYPSRPFRRLLIPVSTLYYPPYDTSSTILHLSSLPVLDLLVSLIHYTLLLTFTPTPAFLDRHSLPPNSLGFPRAALNYCSYFDYFSMSIRACAQRQATACSWPAPTPACVSRPLSASIAVHLFSSPQGLKGFL